MHLTGFNQAHTKDFYLRRVQIFQKWISSWFSECGHFCQNSGVFCWVFFLPQRVQIWQKRTLSWILSYFFVQKYIKFLIFQTCFARKQQFGGLFCRLGNLGGAMHPCTPPHNGHAFNMYWWYRIVHVQQTLNYTNLTTAPKCKKPNLNLCMCAGVGVWVLLESPFCVKHPIFTNISWDFDYFYKDSTCSIQCLKFKASTCRLHFGLECHCHRSKRYPPFDSDLPIPSE